jgi:membrane protein involved in colicin uptake
MSEEEQDTQGQQLEEGSGGNEDATAPGDDDARGEPQPDWKAEAEKWKALSRKHESQAKTNAEAAKRLKELEDAAKSELQKATDGKASADRQAAEQRAEAMRLRVALRKGLTETQAKRLVGESEEELEADADELLASFTQTKGSAADGGGKPTRPKERLRPGASSDEEPEETDPRKLAAAVPRF